MECWEPIQPAIPNVPSFQYSITPLFHYSIVPPTQEALCLVH